MLDLRLIKKLVSAVLIFYLMKKRLPFVIEELAKRSVAEAMQGSRPLDPILRQRYLRLLWLFREQPDAVTRGDMTFQERLVVITAVFLYLSLPDWIRTPW